MSSAGVTCYFNPKGDIVTSPLISILRHLCQQSQKQDFSIELLYSVRKEPSDPLSSILFYDRLKELFANERLLFHREFGLFLTSPIIARYGLEEHPKVSSMSRITDAADGHTDRIHHGRFSKQDLLNAIGPTAQRNRTIAYVCGPPMMTDWYVLLSKCPKQPCKAPC